MVAMILLTFNYNFTAERVKGSQASNMSNTFLGNCVDGPLCAVRVIFTPLIPRLTVMMMLGGQADIGPSAAAGRARTDVPKAGFSHCQMRQRRSRR